jgi:flagellar biosynthetic protein FliP
MRLLLALVLALAAAAFTASLAQAAPLDGLTLLSATPAQGGSAYSLNVQTLLVITGLAFLPGILLLMTAFTRIIIVLSLLRSALATQSTPPNMVLIGLALFLTYFVMQPVLDQAWTTGLLPLTQGHVTEMEGLRLTAEPFRRFMVANLRGSDLQVFLDLGHLPVPPTSDDAPWRALIPAFMVGELRRAFEIGFLLFLPFLVIDMVVASVLMSLGMMMLPPNVVSLPFKLIFFVLVDGWRLVAGSLVQSFASGQ